MQLRMRLFDPEIEASRTPDLSFQNCPLGIRVRFLPGASVMCFCCKQRQAGFARCRKSIRSNSSRVGVLHAILRRANSAAHSKSGPYVQNLYNPGRILSLLDSDGVGQFQLSRRPHKSRVATTGYGIPTPLFPIFIRPACFFHFETNVDISFFPSNQGMWVLKIGETQNLLALSRE